MKRVKVKELSAFIDQQVKVCGWVRTKRKSKKVVFVHLNDGSCLANLQIVIGFNMVTEETFQAITTGACIAVTGQVVVSQGKGQQFELLAKEIDIIGLADPEEYPLQPKKHSYEFLREIGHLRIRTNTFGAVFRVRHAMSYAIHHYFNKKGFFHIHSPIITGSDAEGAGEMFRVTTLDPKSPPLIEGEVDYKKDFFGKETNLTVSGQLEAELAAMGLAQVYTFGPTFRAENSNTTRHLAEFWMMEPEVAFYDLNDNMDLAEDLLKYLVGYGLEHCQEDIAFLSERDLAHQQTLPADKRNELSLIERLEFVIDNTFERITYTQAFEILRNSKPNKKKKFEYQISEWGADLQSEHERFLVEKHFNKPVIVYNYPKDIKAFYMRANDDGKTVAAMDILFPGIGEIVGGSQREERFDNLLQRMEELNIPQEEMSWYLDTRKFGTAPHSGFGLGFERWVQFVTGMANIRDVIPFPRTPGNAMF